MFPAGCSKCQEMFELNRDRSYYRYQRNRAINRKLGKLRRIGGNALVYAWTRGEHGRLTKGKIHCSCSLCRVKSYDEPSRRDQAAKDGAIEQLRNY